MEDNKTKEYIKNVVLDWVNDNISDHFKFHEHQLETIVGVVYNVVNDKNHNYVVEAPTGSGKSIICIVCAGVLATYYHLRSYILCSDLYLWQQYADFIKKGNLRGFGTLKGQRGNYTCFINNEDLQSADCKMAKIPYKVLFDVTKAKRRGYGCVQKCEYIRERKNAMISNVCLMTYQLYLNLINTNNEGNYNGFDGRDIVFCDECHNIPSIVQSQYSPIVKESDFNLMSDIYDYCSDEDDCKLFDIYSDFESNIDLKFRMGEIFTSMKNPESNNAENNGDIRAYYNFLSYFKPLCDFIEKRIAKLKFEGISTRDDSSTFKKCELLKSYICFWEDFFTAVLEAGEKYLIKQIEFDDEKYEIHYNCVKEDYMVYRYLLSKTPFKVMLSATVGGKEAFEENIGIKYTEDNECVMVHVPSTFDFTKSPIKCFTRYKMTYKNKEYCFNQLKPLVYKILNKYADKKGIIQTGSYQNAKVLYNTAPPEIQKRLLIYNDSHEKTIILKKHKASKNTILIGPSLNEGIDLPDDLCRFIIIMKVPYPQMKDKLVAVKMKLFPHWYSSTTSNVIIQGIGRGNRNKTDYCHTFILDGCFEKLYMETKEQYSEELQKRITFYD